VEKTDKYISLVSALRHYWGKVDFVAFSIGHAGITLLRTRESLLAALSFDRQHSEQAGYTRVITIPNTVAQPRRQDTPIVKSLFDGLSNLAKSRLLNIIKKRKRLVAALTGALSRNRDTRGFPAHASATHYQLEL